MYLGVVIAVSCLARHYDRSADPRLKVRVDHGLHAFRRRLHRLQGYQERCRRARAQLWGTFHELRVPRSVPPRRDAVGH